MNKNRLEAFSDGVLAIIITIMVLELRPPHSSEWSALSELGHTFVSYVLSFIYVGIYWNNHHHLMHTVKHINGKAMWANLHLLFWLSIFPFATAWAGDSRFAAAPVAFYGFVLLMASIAYYLLTRALICVEPESSALAKAVGKDKKGLLSTALYAVSIPLACWNPLISCALYVTVAAIWLVPDRRIEKGA